MIVKREADKEELEQVVADMCNGYCLLPHIWDEDKMGGELSESDICENCPLNRITKDVIIDNCPANLNGWQE